MFNEHLTTRAWGLSVFAATALFFPIPFGSVKGAKIIFGMFKKSLPAMFPPPIKYDKNRTVCFPPTPLKRANNTLFFLC